MMVELGDLVMATITGFEGIVCGYAVNAYNCDRVQVVSRELKDGKPMDPIWFDVPMVKVIDKYVIECAELGSAFGISVGCMVRDKLTGFEGQVVSKGTWLTGCIRFGVAAKKMKTDGDFMDDLWFSGAQLELISKPEPKNVQPVRTGGPYREPRNKSVC